MFFENDPNGKTYDIVGRQGLFFAANVNFRYPFMSLCEEAKEYHLLLTFLTNISQYMKCFHVGPDSCYW